MYGFILRDNFALGSVCDKRQRNKSIAVNEKRYGWKLYLLPIDPGKQVIDLQRYSELILGSRDRPRMLVPLYTKADLFNKRFELHKDDPVLRKRRYIESYFFVAEVNLDVPFVRSRIGVIG